MSRAYVPPMNDAVTIDSSPTAPAIGVKFTSCMLIIVYSGFVVLSLVPDGEMVNSVVPVPTLANKVASTSPAPYDSNNKNRTCRGTAGCGVA